jgi:predicted nucleic acid-binding Zn ribbon protein
VPLSFNLTPNNKPIREVLVMKICWDNIENLRLSKNGNFWDKKKQRIYYYHECEICGTPFISDSNKQRFCKRKCSNIYNNKSKRLKYNDVKEFIENKGYTLLSKSYTLKDKLTVRCPMGHEYNVAFGNFRTGKRCPVCNGGVSITYDYVKEQIEKEGYRLLSNEYINAHKKLEIECPKGHKYKVIWNAFQQGSRCPVCVAISNSSKMECELYNFVKNITTEDVIANNIKQILNPVTNRYLELDIWIPSLRKAIEFNGEYWHSKKKVMDRDIIKKQVCMENNIELMVVEEKEWVRRPDICMETIRRFVNAT